MLYARSKVDYVIGEFIYMLPSNMNLRIGKVKDYNNKILISSPSFKIGTDLKINLDVKSKEVEVVKTEPDVKPKVITNLTSSLIKNTNKMLKLTSSSIEKAIRMLRNLILIRSPMRKKRLLLYWELQLSLQYGGCSSNYLLLAFVMKYVYIKTPTPVISAHKF